MQVETALPAPPARWRLSRAGAARLTLPLVLLLTLRPELALADRKYGLFSGGFGQSQAGDTPFELAVFAAALLGCQAFLFWLFYRLVRALHRRRADTWLFHFNYFFFVGGGAIAIMVAKYQALAFFSDAMSFQIMRNLGGGSLGDALLYSLSESRPNAHGTLGDAPFH